MVTTTTIHFLAYLRQQQSVLYPTAAFEHPWVLWAIISLTYHIRAAELEFLGQIRGARPLYILIVVVRTSILAAHHLHLVVSAAVAAHAF
jgi:hypothetical protein